MNIEELGRDAHGKISSKPVIKSGKNQGYRQREVGELGFVQAAIAMRLVRKLSLLILAGLKQFNSLDIE